MQFNCLKRTLPILMLSLSCGLPLSACSQGAGAPVAGRSQLQALLRGPATTSLSEVTSKAPVDAQIEAQLIQAIKANGKDLINKDLTAYSATLYLDSKFMAAEN